MRKEFYDKCANSINDQIYDKKDECGRRGKRILGRKPNEKKDCRRNDEKMSRELPCAFFLDLKRKCACKCHEKAKGKHS